MITFYRRLYYGYSLSLKDRRKKVNNTDIGIFIGMSRFVFYSMILFVLRYYDIFSLNEDNIWYATLVFITFETLLSNFLYGKSKLEKIKRDFVLLSANKQKFYKVAGIIVTPVSTVATIIVLYITYGVL